MTNNAIGSSVGTLPQPPSLLGRLLARGDAVSIERGLLVIVPASGDLVPSEWLDKHEAELIRQVLGAVGQDGYHYQSHKTGQYGRHMSAGLTLQFLSVTTQNEAYSIFNVELTRARNTSSGKKGGPLPTGQFRTTQGSNLNKFWQSTGLPLRRLAAMSEYMGKLRNILFSGSPTQGRDDGRLDAGTLRAMSVPASSILYAMRLDNVPTIAGQDPDKYWTNRPDKDLAPAQQSCGLQPVLATCEKQHGKAVIRECDYTVHPCTFPATRKPVHEQSTDEWLDAYGSSDL